MEHDEYEHYKKFVKNRQYFISGINKWTWQYYFPHIKESVAQKLYKESVDEILTVFGIDNLADASFGRGFLLVNRLFEDKLKRYPKIVK